MEIIDDEAVIIIVRCYPKQMPEGGMVQVERQNWRPLQIHRDVVAKGELGGVVGKVIGNMVDEVMYEETPPT